MKLCDLLSVIHDSDILIYTNPCSYNSFNSLLLLKIETFQNIFGKVYLYEPNESYYLLYKNHNVVSVIDGKLGICVFVEESSHGKV